jgi:hypothetical protein
MINALVDCRVFLEKDIVWIVNGCRVGGNPSRPLFLNKCASSPPRTFYSHLCRRQGERQEPWVRPWKLFLEKSSWRLCNAKAVAWGDLTIAAESLHQFSGLNPAVDSVLRGDIRDVLMVYSDHDHGANTSTHSRARDVETMRSPLRLMNPKQEK